MLEEITKEANYCLNCKVKPCSRKGCPLNNDIPLFIEKIKNEKYEEAYNILCKTTVLPAICGRICPHKKQCEGSCIRGIKNEPVNIGNLESYIGDFSIKENFSIKKLTLSEEDVDINKEIYLKKIRKRQVAIIGGGPAGLTCAAFLARKGVKVTIYERYNYLGGLMIYGIPDFRLEKEIVKKSIKKILDLGIEVKYNQELGKNINLSELKEIYDVIVLAFGANKSKNIRIEGGNLNGVFGGNELLEYNLHPQYKGKTVIVNGGGNVAMDVARTVKRLGAKKVVVVYRRSKEQMPAEEKEINAAINEGIEFLFQNNIVKIIGNEKNAVKKVELIKTELIKKEGETRLSPVNIEESNYEINTDYIIMALGSKPEEFVSKLGLQLNQWNGIKVDEKNKTSDNKIYAIGDLAGNTQTVAWAAKSGRDTAENIIDEFLKY